MKRVSILAIVACMSLAGCSIQSGNQALADQSSEKLNESLIKGKTTTGEVYKIFGEPDDTDIMNDGRVKWVYKHIHKSEMARNYIPIVNWFSKGTDDTTRKLIIVFKGDVLEQFSSSVAKGETVGGLVT